VNEATGVYTSAGIVSWVEAQSGSLSSLSFSYEGYITKVIGTFENEEGEGVGSFLFKVILC
jgi:hypothetical protein